MSQNVLLIDGRGRPRALSRCLEALGARCLSARGPLRAESILSKGQVALMVWREDPHNPGVREDLFAVWERFPRVLVVHLFPDGGHAAHRVHPQIIAALPWAGFQELLPPVVAPLLAGGAPPVTKPAPPHSELAFRNVWGRMRNEGEPIIAPPGLGGDAGHYAAATSVNPSEREHLANKLRPVGEGGRAEPRNPAGWWPLRRR